MNKEDQLDINELVNYSLKFAQTLLIDAGEYYPFGAKVNLSGELIPVSFFDEDEFPESQKLINGLTAYLSNEKLKNNIRAYCITYDITLSNEKYKTPIDAILILVNHSEVSGSLKFYFPYEIDIDQSIKLLESWVEHDHE